MATALVGQRPLRGAGVTGRAVRRLHVCPLLLCGERVWQTTLCGAYTRVGAFPGENVRDGPCGAVTVCVPVDSSGEHV